jgi:multiple sugar transport system substrate-binding protein/raffinose/stachyose/melibiose transport system substrate-binding protein
VLGPNAESNLQTMAAIGIFNGARHPELALDFLRFLGSQRGAERFSRRSQWLPAVAGVAPPSALTPFYPKVDGFPAGPPPTLLGTDTRHLVMSNLYRLVASRGSVDDFAGALRAGYPAALREALRREIRTQQANTLRLDTIRVARMWLAEHDPERRADHLEKLSLLEDIQVTSDGKYLHYDLALRTLDHWPDVAACPDIFPPIPKLPVLVDGTPSP